MSEFSRNSERERNGRYMRRVFFLAFPIVMAPCLVGFVYALKSGNYLPFWGSVAYAWILVWAFGAYTKIGRDMGEMKGWSDAYAHNKDRMNGPFRFKGDD